MCMWVKLTSPGEEGKNRVVLAGRIAGVLRKDVVVPSFLGTLFVMEIFRGCKSDLRKLRELEIGVARVPAPK